MSKLLWRRSVVYSPKSWNRVKEMKQICGSSQIIITLRFDLTLHLQQHLSFRRWAFAICRWVCVFVYIWIDTHSFYPPLAPALSLSMNGIYAEAYTLHIAHIKSSDIRVNISRLTPENNFPSEIVHPALTQQQQQQQNKTINFSSFFPPFFKLSCFVWLCIYKLWCSFYYWFPATLSLPITSLHRSHSFYIALLWTDW